MINYSNGMELLYIWVNGFRNFKNIGFNFSDRFEIEYQKQTKKISVNKLGEKTNIFGNKIINITGVIGKNSTGKSNLLELISIILKSSKNTLTFDFVAVFETENQIYIDSNLQSKIILDRTFYSIDNYYSRDLIVAYFSNIQDDRELNLPSSVINLTPNKSIIKKKSDILNQFKFLLSDDYPKLDLESPKSIIISTITKPPYSKNVRNINAFDDEILTEVNRKFKSALKTTNPVKHFSYSFIYSFFSYVLFEAINETKSEKRELFEVNPDIENLRNIFTNCFNDASMSNIKDLIEAVKKFIEIVFYEFTRVGSLDRKDAMSLMDFDRAIEYLKPDLVKEGKYNRSRAYYLIELNIETTRILKEYISIFNHNRILEISWGGISSGHKAFLNVFSQFYSIVKKVNNKSNILICIDEGDLYMHPVWQQEFLNRLLNYLNLIFKAGIQIILTSHSPFLVSDLPRRNLIYLDRTNENMCSVIPYQESKTETFGANLLDLYANSFFLSGGTISKFAYNKIKDIVNLLKSPNLKKHDIELISHITAIVGDDVIKYKLIKMLEDAKTKD